MRRFALASTLLLSIAATSRIQAGESPYEQLYNAKVAGQKVLLERSKVLLEYARKHLDRVTRLKDTNHVSDMEFDQAQRDYQNLKLAQQNDELKLIELQALQKIAMQYLAQGKEDRIPLEFPSSGSR